MGYRERRSAIRLLGVVGLCAALSACGPVGDDRDVLPVEEGADAVEAEREDSTGEDDSAGDGSARENGAREDGAGEERLVIGAPFRIPSPSERTLDGDELTRRIVDACEAAQPSPAPPGPCVEVVIVPRPDPERDPGQWIGTDPAGGQQVTHGTTVTLFVAEARSPTQDLGTEDTSTQDLGTDDSGSDGSAPDEPPADLDQADGGDADGGA